MRRVLCFLPHHSKPGTFIAQIAAMKTAFARGRTANVSANAVSGQTVMLTKRGQRKTVSAYNADGTTKWLTMMIVSHAGPSSA
jgi:hypothetical protein